VPTEHRSGAILWKQATDLAPFPPYPWSVLLHGDRGDGPYFFIAIKRYIHGMVSRTYGRGRPLNAPAAFIHPCQPIVAKQPPSGPGWAHELKLDGYRLQIHVRDGRVHLYTINGADWSKRYPLFVRDAAKIKARRLLTPKWFGSIRTACRTSRRCIAVPVMPKRPPVRLTFLCATVMTFVGNLIPSARQYCLRRCAVAALGPEGIVSKKLDAPYRSGPSKTWIKVKNPKSPAANRAADGTF
jgi:bifunctional non-homologous end joining protein LigD